ncbi:MAG: hypothetical protein QW478_03600 [Candidatus Micrarchaeaceae archaeon]
MAIEVPTQPETKIAKNVLNSTVCTTTSLYSSIVPRTKKTMANIHLPGRSRTTLEKKFAKASDALYTLVIFIQRCEIITKTRPNATIIVIEYIPMFDCLKAPQKKCPMSLHST